MRLFVNKEYESTPLKRLADGRTYIHGFDRGTLTGQRYRDEILAPFVRLFRGAYGPNFVFMDDNARPHKAQLVNEYLESEGVQRMEWSAMSPELNTIEHVWDALGRSIAARIPAPTTIDDLKVQGPGLGARVGAVATGIDKDAGKECETPMRELYVAVTGDHTPY